MRGDTGTREPLREGRDLANDTREAPSPDGGQFYVASYRMWWRNGPIWSLFTVQSDRLSHGTSVR